MPLACFPDARRIANHLKHDSKFPLSHELRDNRAFSGLAEKIGDVFQNQERDFPGQIGLEVHKAIRACTPSDATMERIATLTITQSLGRLLAASVYDNPPSDVRAAEARIASAFLRDSLK